jgi:drug/metabolite transporter (DMT)-like permease
VKPDVRAGYRRVLAAVLLFSVNPVLLRQLALDAVTILAAVSALAVLTLLAAGIRHGRPAQLFSRAAAWNPTIRLSFWFAVNNALYLTAVQKTSIANATMTHYLAPLLVAALAAPLLGERVHARAVWAMGLACTGVLVMMAGSGLSLGDAHFIGLLAGTGSALFFALEIIEKKILAPTDAADLVAARYLLLSTILLAPFVDYAALAAAPVDDLAILLLIGVVTSACGNVLFTSGLRTVEAQHAATIGYLEPLGAVVWALLLIGERPDGFGIAGGSLVVAGILIVVTASQPSRGSADRPRDRGEATTAP